MVNKNQAYFHKPTLYHIALSVQHSTETQFLLTNFYNKYFSAAF